ncbi:hypothetical protein AK812_SmicGene42996 [Symbiodinium microadriaticum]|uniref:Endonuclease/exonuclease/phosphatase domain-containing protein n=1 Tax=Symbiodinium microadriaticum TaxID=2951 RepID=A0A1Q9C249_SYMMI|nr:hypothetical protein AK812_SmicGene42996 [Symbiodinium microadriaticum]CAE7232845.1 unnamed protein product [Symbiodinium microadriaticum]
MGRGDKWNRPQHGGQYEGHRPHYGGNGGRQEPQRPWRVWPGAFSPGQHRQKPEVPPFPRYDSRPLPTSQRSQNYSSGTEGQTEEGRGFLVNDVQQFINMARKAEQRVKSLSHSRRQREAQWEKYVVDMKATLQQEYQRHQQSLSKLDEDLQLAHQHQEESRSRLCHVIEMSMGRRAQEAGRPNDQQWEEMVNQWEQEASSRSNPLEVVRRAYSGAPPPDFGISSTPMPPSTAPVPGANGEPTFHLDPAWGPGPPSGFPTMPPPTAPPHPERADGARGQVKARTPPKKADPGISLAAKLDHKRSCGSLDFLAYATCAERCDLVHIIVDLTSVGGHYFADAVPSHLSVYDFLWQYAEDVKYEVERLDVRVGPQALGRVPSAALGVHTGDAVIVLPAPAPVIWQNRLGSFFEPGHIWTPLRLVPGSPFTPGLAVWLQGCLHSFPGGRLNDADTHARIAQLTGQQRDRMRVVTFQGLHDFALKGELCHSVVVPLDAFLEHNSLSGDNLTLALVDARCLGLSVVVCNLPAGVPSVSDCASAVGITDTHGLNIQAVEQELDDDFYRLFSLLVAMRPQATPEWGLLLALPAWAIDEPVCAIDLLEIDGRVFSVVLPWWFTSRDIIVCADLDPALEYDIFPFGRSTAIDAFEEVNLVRHGLIVVRPRGTEPPVLRHLSDMLSHGIGWDLSTDAPAIVPHDRAGQVCIVLPDRQAPFTLLPGRRQHYHHDLAHAFGVPIHWLTVQVAKPPILDAALHGRACKGVALVCDGVPNVPIPPRRPGPCVFGIVLDCRPLLLGWRQWIVVDSRCQHSQIVEHFGLLSPGEHQVQVEGADIQDDFLLVQPGHVLVLQYVPVTPSSHIPAAEDGAVDITDVGADYVHTDAGIGASLDHTPLDAAPRPGDRSRSPRGRSSAPERHRHGSTAGPEPGGILACALLACLPGAVGAEVPRNFFLEGGYGSCTFDCARGAGDGDFGGQVACRHTFPAYSQYASWHPLAECAITAVFGWSMFVVPVLLKLLVEPSTYTLADAEHLSHMRLLTVRLGGRWLRDNNHWFQDHDFETDPDTDEQGDTLVPPVVCWICCIILKYGYSPEEVVVAAHLPLTLEEFTHLVQDARRGDIKHIYPHLLPVSPQPVFGNAVFLAGPAFAADLLGACLDATLIDGRLFACHVPDYISRHEILQFADLLPSADVEVYIGSDVGAIVDETPFHVFPGVWIRIQPKGCQHPPDACLGLQLLRDVGWSDEAQLPVPVFEGDAYCLVHGGEYCLHFTDPVHPTHYRRYIAARVGLQVADIDVQAAAPRPSDVEICGYPCRSVLAVTHCSDIRQGPARQVVVIDCRPIHEGWCVAFANNGEFASRAFAQGLNQTAPRGWQTSLNVAIDAAGLSRVRAGQVIVVTYAPHGEPTGSAPAAEHSSDAIASPGQDTANRQRDVEHTDTGAAIRTVQTRTQSAAWEDDSFVPFLLFSQEVWPEFVVPQLRLPTDIHSAIASVAQARDAWDHRKRSRLIAVRPQPRWEQICLLALPSWPFQGVVILIDNRIAPGGIFAVNVPSFLVRDDVLRLAEVAEDTRYQVYHGDVPWPCPTGVHIPLEDGDLLTICDGLAGPGRFPDVGQMLTPRWQWEFVPDLPGGSRLTSWVLTDGIHYAVSVDSDTFAANNAEVAERTTLQNIPLTRDSLMSQNLADDFVCVVREDTICDLLEVLTAEFLPDYVREAEDLSESDAQVSLSEASDAAVEPVLPIHVVDAEPQVFVDSLVALRQTNGVYGSAADSVIAHACRALAQAADSLGGVRSVSSMSVLTGAECLDWLWLYISATRSRILYVKSQLDACGATITGLQETRVKDTGTLVSETHLRYFAARDAKGNGGVELWFSRTSPFAWDDDKPIFFHPNDFRALAWNERYLIVRFVRQSVRITFAVIHALSATHPDREKWWAAFSAKLHACAQDDEVVLLGDWNTRFDEPIAGRIGDLVWPSPHGVPSTVYAMLSRHDLWVPSTFSSVHSGDSHTWVAPGGNATARIDYIAIPERWFAYPGSSRVLYEVDFGQTGLDHYAVVADIQFVRSAARFGSSTPPNIDVHQLTSDEAQPVLHQICHSAPLVPWDVDVHEHYEELASYLREKLRAQFPVRRARCRRTYFSSTTWELRQQRLWLRKRLHGTIGRLQGLEGGCAFWAWKLSVPVGRALLHILAGALRDVADARSHISELRGIRAVFRRAIIQDRTSHLRDVANAALALPTKDVVSRLRPLLGPPKRKQRQQVALPAVRLEDGTLAGDNDSANDRWLRHFCELEDGRPIGPADLVQQCRQRQQSRDLDSVSLDYRRVPSRVFFEDCIRRAPTGRACGNDGIPADLLHLQAHSLSLPFFQVALKASFRLAEPIHWKGGALHAIWKRKGPVDLCESFRGILVSSAVGKAFHSSLRRKAAPLLDQAAGTFQIGGRTGQPVQLANQTVRIFQTECTNAGASCAVVFLDLKEAFHRVVRPLIVGGPLDDRHVSNILNELHLPSDAYSRLQDYVRDTPIFADAGADEWTAGILGEALTDTWFTWGHEGGLASVRGGTRPGDNLADMLFSFLFSEVLRRIRVQLQELGHVFCYPWHDAWHCSLNHPHGPTEHLQGPSDVTWMDDLALLFRFQEIFSRQCLQLSRLRATARAWHFRLKGLLEEDDDWPIAWAMWHRRAADFLLEADFVRWLGGDAEPSRPQYSTFRDAAIILPWLDFACVGFPNVGTVVPEFTRVLAADAQSCRPFQVDQFTPHCTCKAEPGCLDFSGWARAPFSGGVSLFSVVGLLGSFAVPRPASSFATIETALQNVRLFGDIVRGTALLWSKGHPAVLISPALDCPGLRSVQSLASSVERGDGTIVLANFALASVFPSCFTCSN